MRKDLRSIVDASSVTVELAISEKQKRKIPMAVGGSGGFILVAAKKSLRRFCVWVTRQ